MKVFIDVDEPVSHCWLQQFWPHTCEPPFDRAHIGLTKQYLRQKGLNHVCRDPRVWRWCCRPSHHRLDNGFIRLRRYQLPESVEQFAEEHGLAHRLDRDFGPREVAA